MSDCFKTATTSKSRPPLLLSITANLNEVSSGCFQLRITFELSRMFRERSVTKEEVSTANTLAAGKPVASSCATHTCASRHIKYTSTPFFMNLMGIHYSQFLCPNVENVYSL